MTSNREKIDHAQKKLYCLAVVSMTQQVCDLQKAREKPVATEMIIDHMHLVECPPP
jgi:hypothetical protein